MKLIEKNGGRLFRRPKLTLSCSAEEKEGRNFKPKAGGSTLFLIIGTHPPHRVL
jgi:hypothetical protein